MCNSWVLWDCYQVILRVNREWLDHRQSYLNQGLCSPSPATVQVFIHHTRQMGFVLHTNQHKEPMDRNMAFQHLVQSKGVQKGVYKRCCLMVPIAILPSVCLCYWNLNWIMSQASSCSSAVPARPQTVSPIVEKLTVECLSTVLPHHLPTLGPALSQLEFILIHAHGKGQ